VQPDDRISRALLLLRLSVFLVMLMWTMDKLLNPAHAAQVYTYFYGIGGLGPGVFYAIGAAELLLLLGFVVGFQKRFTCGAVLVLHASRTMSTAARAEYRRIAVFGGLYSNSLALEAMLEDARRHDVEAVFCLGDMGGFGPHPTRVFPLLLDRRVQAIQGNYDASVASGRADCGCGYTDPRGRGKF
jgi:hypothetical protein